MQQTLTSTEGCWEAFPSLVLSKLSLLPGDMTTAGWLWVTVVPVFFRGIVSCSNKTSDLLWAFDGGCFSVLEVWDARDVIGLGITEDLVFCWSEITNIIQLQFTKKFNYSYKNIFLFPSSLLLVELHICLIEKTYY